MAPQQVRERARQLIGRPRLADPEADRIAASAHTMALWLLAGACLQALTLGLVLEQPRRALELDFLLLATCLTSLLLARGGRPRLASALLVAVFYLAATGAVVLGGRIGAALSTFYVLAILTAGLLLGGRAVVAVAALCAGTGALLAYLEQRGLLVPWIPYSTWSSWWAQGVSFLIAALWLRDVLGRLRGALRRAESSEAEARAVFEQASDGIVIANRSGDLLDVNARAAEIAGRAREEVVREGLGSVLAPDEAAAARPRFAELAPGEVRFREVRVPHRDGGERFVEATSTALSDGRILSILRDVTARRREQAEREQIRTALDHLGEGIVLFDADGRVIYANRAIAAFFEGELRVEQGMSGRLLAKSPGAPSLGAEVVRAIRGDRTFRGRFERQLADGSRAVRHVTVAPVRDPGGGIAAAAIVQDVTRETELEESLLRAQKLEAVGRLAAGLAHDFNNLLTVLFGAVETLSEEELPTEAARQAAREIRTTAEVARDSIAELLSLSRRRLTRRQVLDPNAVIEESAGMLRRLMRRNVRLTLRLDREVGCVEADPFQLHQLLLNLAANSRDAMPQGGELEVSTSVCPVTPAAPALGLAPGDYVLLSVRDTGVGMDAATRQHLFEPFFTTKAEGQGTGLGLVSVRSTVEESGGEIEVESAPGQGTTVRVYLPRVAVSLAPEPTAPARAARARSARILLVEDDDVVRATILRALQRTGHRVEAARSGEEALRIALVGEDLDLLITDVQMPGLDGPTLARRLRERLPDLHVLFTSGYADDERLAGLAPGRSEFLPKPFAPGELTRMVGEMIAGE
jgi:PAS domain S-box-containing protein